MRDITVIGTQVVLRGERDAIYDAACPEVAPVLVDGARIAYDQDSNTDILLVAEGNGLTLAPSPECGVR